MHEREPPRAIVRGGSNVVNGLALAYRIEKLIFSS